MKNVRARIGAAGLVTAAVAAMATGAILIPAQATQSVATDRLAGTNRYDTARVIAEYKAPGSSAFAFGSPTQGVLVSGDNFPDALAASFLAGSYKSPTLLTARDALRSEAVQGFKDLGISRVTIIGGSFAVAAAEDDQLKAEGITPTRIAGVNRDDTAAKVAQAPGTIVANYGDKGATALLAADNSAHYADALAAGSLSWVAHLPVLLTPTEALAPETRAALSALNVRHVVILGGPAAVSTTVEGEVTAMGLSVERLQGATRQATAVAIANAEHDLFGFLFTRVFLALGINFPDALAGGPIAGLLKNPTLLTADTNTLGSDTRTFLTADDGTVGHITAFGGPGAISDTALHDAAQTSSCKPSSGSGGILPIPGGSPNQPAPAAASSTTTSTSTSTSTSTTSTSTSTSTTTTTLPPCATTTTSTPTSTSSTTSTTSTTAPGGTTTTAATVLPGGP